MRLAETRLSAWEVEIVNDVAELFKLALVGLVSSLFTYYLSNRRHRAEKWWELRVAAYQETISALSDLCHYFNSHLNIEMQNREVAEDKKQELKQYWNNGYNKVRKAADAGAFLFSAEAETELKLFLKGNDELYNTFFEYCDERSASAKKCLDALVLCSKKDLRLHMEL